jgi:hypothetical protein
VTFYSDLAAEVVKVLTQYGQAMTLRDKGMGVYDTTTSTNTPGAPVDQTRQGALFNFGSGQTRFNGELILVNDRKMLMDASGTKPSQEHIVLDVAGNIWTIINVQEVNPAGTVVAYTLQVRR